MSQNTTSEFSKISLSFHVVLFIWIFSYFIHYHHCTRSGKLRLVDYAKVVTHYGLVDPFELPGGIDVEDMEDLTNCTCPRSYYGCCGLDNQTYFNPCVLHCINTTEMRRLGPCIIYRRSTIILVDVNIPSIWKETSKKVKLNRDMEYDAVLLAAPSGGLSKRQTRNVSGGTRLQKGARRNF